MSLPKRGSFSIFATPLATHRKSYLSLAAQSEEDECTAQPLPALIKILKKPINQRNLKNLQSLLAFTHGIKFFKQVAVDISEEAVTQCCIYMTYEQFNKGEYVIRQGEKGSKFYVLLDGTCTVFVNVWAGNMRSAAIPVAYYYKGDSFGELALLHNKPRAASIFCTQDSHFAVLEKEDYTRILAKVHEIAINKKVDFLQSLPMFNTWTRSSMQKLIYYFKEKSVQRNQVLYKTGETAETVYFIRQGEIQILQDVKLPSVSGSAQIPKYQTTKTQIAILGNGECVGCEEVLTSGIYQYTSVCHSLSAQLLFISKEDFTKRVNTEESLKSIRELMRLKEELRKGQVEGGKKIRESEGYKPCGGARNSSPPRMDTQEIVTERLKQTSSLITDRMYSMPPRNVHTTSISYIPLYPFRDKIRDSGFRISHKSGIGQETISNMRRIKSWDRIIALKTSSDTRPKQSPRAEKNPKIVNIHTYKQRKQAEPGPIRKSLSSMSVRKPGSKRSIFSDESRYVGCLTINSVEMVTKDQEEEEESRAVTARFERIVTTPHSQFRLKRVVGSPSF